MAQVRKITFVKKSFMHFFIVFMAFCFFSCTTLQSDIVFSEDNIVLKKRSDILLQKLLILDGKYLANNHSLIDEESCFKLIAEIEEEIASNQQNTLFLAKLYGMLGRANLLLGKSLVAKTAYKKADSLHHGEPHAIILGTRLCKTVQEKEEFLVVAKPQSDSEAPLILEQAIVFYEKKEYAAAVASFDKAFLQLPQVYVKSYDEIRATSWNLRFSSNVEDSLALNFINSDSLTAEGMVVITNTQSKLLDSIKGREKLSSKNIFNISRDVGFFNPSKPQRGLSSDEYKLKNSIKRVLVARFLWNVYCWKTGSYETQEYSLRYEKRQAISPIKDVPLESGDFDAVIAMVQLEVMDLIDGKNFYPQGSVSGSTFLQWLKKLESQL